MDRCMIGKQCNGNSLATSTAANWWPDVHATSICSWTGGANYASTPPCNNRQDPNSNCSGGEEDVSISTSFTTNASNNSGLSMESSQRLVEKASTNDPYGEAVSDNHHIWNQVLLGVGTTGELQSMSTRMFEPACDFLKKIDGGWEVPSPTNHNQFQKNFNGLNDGLHQRKNPSSARSWSIASPDAEISPQFDQYGIQITAIRNEHVECGTESEGLFQRGLSSHATEYQERISDLVLGDNTKYYYNGMPDLECTNGSGLVHLVGFDSYLNKPSSECNMSNKHIKSSLNLPERRKQGIHSSYQPIRARSSTLAKINGRGNGIANEGKRKKSEEQSGAVLLKKTKLETSTESSTKLIKVQVPKAKLGDKITALQQIVSPFGKTDTASVLWEAIGFIKCLQEQIQLLSNPYMKTSIIKDTWVHLEMSERGKTNIDLKSKGLCLVPLACTPQVYHDNNGSDYLSPTYRGCFYR